MLKYIVYSIPETKVAFYNDGAQTGPQNILQFQNIYVNVGSGLQSTNKFIVPQCGFYWLHLYMRTENTSECAVILAGTAKLPSLKILKKNPTYPHYDVISRNDLRWISGRTQISVSSPSLPVATWSWCGFDLATLMNPLIAFSVYSSIQITSPASPLPFPFPNITADIGQAWNSTTHKFVTPVSGIYIFGFSTAAILYKASTFSLVIDNNVLYNAEMMDTLHPGVDLTSRSVVVSLTTGQSVWITGNGTDSYSDFSQFATFKGFYYAPEHGIQVAWSVHSTMSLFNISNIPLPFNLVSVNKGNVWNGTMVIISVAGYYHISVVATQAPSAGLFPYLYLNNVAILSFLKSGNSSNNVVTREGIVIRNCVVGDKLHVQLNSGQLQAYSSFSGFLIFPA